MNSRSVADIWQRGSPYERYIGRWSRRVAPQFLDWLDLPPHQRWVDVGCGAGALCAAIADAWHHCRRTNTPYCGPRCCPSWLRRAEDLSR